MAVRTVFTVTAAAVLLVAPFYADDEPRHTRMLVMAVVYALLAIAWAPREK